MADVSEEKVHGRIKYAEKHYPMSSLKLPVKRWRRDSVAVQVGLGREPTAAEDTEVNNGYSARYTHSKYGNVCFQQKICREITLADETVC